MIQGISSGIDNIFTKKEDLIPRPENDESEAAENFSSLLMSKTKEVPSNTDTFATNEIKQFVYPEMIFIDVKSAEKETKINPQIATETSQFLGDFIQTNENVPLEGETLKTNKIQEGQAELDSETKETESNNELNNQNIKEDKYSYLTKQKKSKNNPFSKQEKQNAQSKQTDGITPSILVTDTRKNDPENLTSNHSSYEFSEYRNKIQESPITTKEIISKQNNKIDLKNIDTKNTETISIDKLLNESENNISFPIEISQFKIQNKEITNNPKEDNITKSNLDKSPNIPMEDQLYKSIKAKEQELKISDKDLNKNSDQHSFDNIKITENLTFKKDSNEQEKNDFHNQNNEEKKTAKINHKEKETTNIEGKLFSHINKETENSSQTKTQEISNRIVREVERFSIPKNSGSAKIEISDGKNGTIQIEIKIDADKNAAVSVKVSDNDLKRNLESSSNQLKESLERKDFKLTDIKISGGELSSQLNDSNSRQNGDNNRHQNQTNNWNLMQQQNQNSSQSQNFGQNNPQKTTFLESSAFDQANKNNYQAQNSPSLGQKSVRRGANGSLRVIA